MDFIECIERKDDARHGIMDAYMSGAVAFAALESMRTGQVVEVPPL